MKQPLIIGADVGGSHISCSAVRLKSNELKTYNFKLDSKAEKTRVFENWAKPINKVIQQEEAVGTTIQIGFAMPGPFDYKNGIALFDKNVDKYHQLYSADISDEFSDYLVEGDYTFRFINDAMAFAIGATNAMQLNDHKVLVLTLGTGLGGCFMEKGVPLFKNPDLLEKGWLWSEKFKTGIADDYFSTRWFTGRFFELTAQKVSGVRELVTSKHTSVPAIFQEYVQNMEEFLTPYIVKFKPTLIVLGGNIAKASDYFLADLNKVLAKFDVKVVVSTVGEEAAIIGSAQLFEPDFWEKIKEDL